MIKYLNYAIAFQEVPDEVSLCFNITNCQHSCPGCHSPELQEDRGDNLETDMLQIIERYKDGITCVCFMGEGNDIESLVQCLCLVRGYYPDLKVCLYSGKNGLDRYLFVIVASKLVDYLKLGPYIEECGGLSNPNTNQHMYYIRDGTMEDITYKFWRKKV